MTKNYILQIDLARIDADRIVDRIRSNGDEAQYYNLVLSLEDNEDEKGNIGVACEKLLKVEYDAGKQGRKIGYIQPLKKHT